MKLTAAISLALLVSFATPAFARDWFVRADASGGDGTQGKPFADPWQALDKCEAGDSIHIAGGKYYGRSDVGTWEVPFDNISLYGGWDKDFKERDPWKNQTQLLWRKDAKNWPKEERLGSNMKNTLVDGITIDMRDQNKYADDAQTGRAEGAAEKAMLFGKPAIVRNCVIINPGTYGIEGQPGSTFENNLILNALGWGIVVNGSSNDWAKIPTVIKNNTVLFSQDERKPGAGGYAGAAIALKGPATVTNNILAHSDNNSIYITINPEKITLSDNLFFANLFSNVKLYVDGKDTPIDDKQMDLLDEAGFKAAERNEVKSPGLDFDPKWMDRFSKRTASQPGKLVMDDFNKMRQLMGLPMIAKGGEPASGVAPAYDLDKAARLLNPKSAGKAGARVVKVDVPKFSAAAASASRDYAKAEIVSWAKNPGPVNGKAFEMVVAIGGVANVGGIPAEYKKDDHAGVDLHQKDGDHDRVIGFFKKGSSV